MVGNVQYLADICGDAGLVSTVIDNQQHHGGLGLHRLHRLLAELCTPQAVELEGDPIDNFLGHVLGLEAETRIDFAITFLFPVKHPAPTANHQPFSQLSEVIREVRPVGDVVGLVVVVDVHGGDGCAVVNVLDLGKERGEAPTKASHPLVLGITSWGDQHFDNWPRREEAHKFLDVEPRFLTVLIVDNIQLVGPVDGVVVPLFETPEGKFAQRRRP